MKRQLYLATILAIILSFILGLLIGTGWTTQELNTITQSIKTSELATQSYLLEQELLEGLDHNCNLAQARLNTLTTDLSKLGKLLDTPTAKKDLGNKQYDVLKRRFHLLQIHTYVLHLRLQKECNLTTPVILFYYAQNDPASTEQGKILDQLATEKQLRIFAIEHNYSPELLFLQEYYNIKTTPSIIINYNKTFTTLTSYDTLANALS